MEGAPTWIVSILQNYGLAGVVIFVLAFICYLMYKNSIEVNNSRLGERDVLIKTIESNTQAAKDNTKATEDRNVVTKALADAISAQAGAFQLFVQKMEMQNDTIREKLGDQKMVIDAVSQSNSVMAGMLRDMQRMLDSRSRKVET